MNIDDITCRLTEAEVRAAHNQVNRIGMCRYAVLFEGETRSVALICRALGRRHARVRAVRRVVRAEARR